MDKNIPLYSKVWVNQMVRAFERGDSVRGNNKLSDLPTYIGEHVEIMIRDGKTSTDIHTFIQAELK
jgi:hypothetical protein